MEYLYEYQTDFKAKGNVKNDDSLHKMNNSPERSTFLKSNNKCSKYIWQNSTELHKGTDKFTTTVENF